MTDLSIVDRAVDSVGSAGESAIDSVVGGAALALDAARRPRRTAARARRRGSEANQALVEATEELVEEAVALPERALLGYVRLLRRQGVREDVVGGVSRALLGAVHGQAKGAARFFTRLEKATDVDAHGRRRTTTPAARRGGRKRTTGATRRTSSAGARSAATRGRARRSA
jgi:hypothetical protein